MLAGITFHDNENVSVVVLVGPQDLPPANAGREYMVKVARPTGSNPATRATWFRLSPIFVAGSSLSGRRQRSSGPHQAMRWSTERCSSVAPSPLQSYRSLANGGRVYI